MRVVAVSLLLTALAAAQQWPQFRGTARLTGIAGPIPSELRLLWTFEAGEAVESSPAIVDGAVYVASHAGELVSLDLASGKLRWRYRTGEPVGESSPAVAHEVVYVGDLAGVVHAVNAADGRRIWTFKTGNEIKASPVVSEGKVLIGSYDGRLFALDARKGTLVWTVETDGPVHATAAVTDGHTFITGCDGVLRAIRIQDGKESYQINIGSYTGSSPALAGHYAYFGTFDNEVLAVDMAKRAVAWRYEHPQRKFPFYSSPALSEGHVLIGGRDKMLHCLNARTGKAVWAFMTRARIDSSPVVSGSRVFFGSNDGRIYAVDITSGKRMWDYDAGAPVSASPAVAGGRILVGTQDGRVLCFGDGT